MHLDRSLEEPPGAWQQAPEHGFNYRAQIFDFALEPPKTAVGSIDTAGWNAVEEVGVPDLVN